MDAKVEIIAAGTYEDALKAGQDAAGKFAKGAKKIKIKATRIKKTLKWKVTLTYQRDSDDRANDEEDRHANMMETQRKKIKNDCGQGIEAVIDTPFFDDLNVMFRTKEWGECND